MTQFIKDVFDLRDEAPSHASDVPASKLAKSAAGFGIVSSFCGLLSTSAGPIQGAWLWNTPGWVFLAAFLSVVTGLVALVLSIAGTIRIGCSDGRFHGYGLCLWGSVLAILGNFIWMWTL